MTARFLLKLREWDHRLCNPETDQINISAIQFKKSEIHTRWTIDNVIGDDSLLMPVEPEINLEDRLSGGASLSRTGEWKLKHVQVLGLGLWTAINFYILTTEGLWYSHYFSLMYFRCIITMVLYFVRIFRNQVIHDSLWVAQIKSSNWNHLFLNCKVFVCSRCQGHDRLGDISRAHNLVNIQGDSQSQKPWRD